MKKRVIALHREAQLLAVLAYNLEHSPPQYIRLRVERLAKIKRKMEDENSIQPTETNSSVPKAAE